MLAAVGFVMILLLIIGLVKFKLLPITVFSTLPLLAALAVGADFPGAMKMVAMGMIDVLPTAALFVGSITYFGVMSDAGMFDRPVNWLTRRIRPSVFSVLVIACCVAMISHLDGSGATTILITVPAMLPVAKAMKVRVLPLSFVITMTIGVMNFLLWGGPLGRAATVVGSDTVTLWKQVLPIQLLGMALLFVTCWLLAKQEEKHGYGAVSLAGGPAAGAVTPEEEALKRPGLFWYNLGLTVLVIVLLFVGVPAFIPFLLGLAIALPLNYGKGGEAAQTTRIKAQAKNVLPMIITIIGAGMLLGVLNGSGMIDAMTGMIVSVIPASLGKFLHVIMDVLAIPLSLVFEADTMNFGILPVVTSMGQAYGVSPIKSALAIAVGHNMGIGMCMTSATVYFALGLFGIEYSEALKYGFWKTLAFGVVLVLFGAVVGVL